MAINKRLVGLLTGIVCYGLSASVAQAVMINEVSPDAGEELATAQDTTGTGAFLDSISGALINLGTTADPIDDIDLYKISIIDPVAFSVMVTASLSDDNDAMLWLFDAAGDQVPDFDPFDINIDDGGVGDLPQINAGELDISLPGEYFLAFNLFVTNPQDTSSTPPTLDGGWFRDPLPTGQSGPYTLSLTGVETAPAGVPEPGVLALLSLGLVGLGFTRRKMKA